MKKFLFLILMGCAVPVAFSSCDKKNPVTPSDDTEQGNPGTPSTPGTPSVTVPDCFVYYKGAKFIFKRTLDDGRVTKITWDVTDYNSSTKTATITSKNGDNDPATFQIRNGSKGIEFNLNSGWKTLTDGGSEINFLLGQKLNSIPSGCYGSIKNTTKTQTVSIPGSKTSSGFQVSSAYSSTSGYHDSFMFDYSSGESWSTECGLTSAGYEYRNGKEYPIFVSTYTISLIAYDIPMPNGTRRTYMPANSTIYDVVDSYINYDIFTASTLRYAALSFYWNDKKNSNVMRYNPYVIWYLDGTWTYAQITGEWHPQWTLYSWFVGKATSGSVIGGPKDGVKFDCEGSYISATRSQSYTPFGTSSSPAYGYYVMFVMAENDVAVGTPDIDNTWFCGIQIPDPSYNTDTYSDRVKLLDNGSVDYYYSSSTTTVKSAPGPFRPAVPDPSMIAGPVYRLNR